MDESRLYHGEHEALADEATWNLVQSNLHYYGHTIGGGNKNEYGAECVDQVIVAFAPPPKLTGVGVGRHEPAPVVGGR